MGELLRSNREVIEGVERSGDIVLVIQIGRISSTLSLKFAIVARAQLLRPQRSIIYVIVGLRQQLLVERCEAT
jgi:hypothetical protein